MSEHKDASAKALDNEDLSGAWGMDSDFEEDERLFTEGAPGEDGAEPQKSDPPDGPPDREEAGHDGGYGWFVVAASFISRFMFSLPSWFGLIYVALLDEFGETRGQTALVGAICFGTSMMAGPISSLLCSRIGHRACCILGGLACSAGFFISAFTPNLTLLYFSIGILVGFGISCQLVPSIAMPYFYFTKRRQLVTGIVSTASGLGTLVLPILIEYVTELYTWRGAFIIIAGISLQGCVAGALLRPNEKSRRNSKHGKNQSLQRNSKSDDKTLTGSPRVLGAQYDVIKSVRFILFAIIVFLATDIYTFLPERALLYGFNSDQAALLLSYTGICKVISILLSGAIMNLKILKKCDYILSYGVFQTLLAVPFLMLTPDVTYYWVVVLSAILYGLIHGALAGTIYSLTILQLFGVDEMTTATGCLLLVEGIGSVCEAPLIALLIDLTSGYQVPFIISALIALTAGVLTIPLYFKDRKRKAREKHTTGRSKCEMEVIEKK